jgi:hypothetical protein
MVTSSSAHQFSTPGIDSIGGVQIKRIGPGEAIGAHDLTRWANRRSAGLSKSYSTTDERKKLKYWTKPPTTEQALTREDAIARGILIEISAFGRGWLVSLPNGSNVGPFKKFAPVRPITFDMRTASSFIADLTKNRRACVRVEHKGAMS